MTLKCPKCGNTKEFVTNQWIEHHEVIINGDGIWIDDVDCYEARHETDGAVLDCCECRYSGDYSEFEALDSVVQNVEGGVVGEDRFVNKRPSSGICPKCGADFCGGYVPTEQDGEMWLEAECAKCDFHWRDVYEADDLDLANSEYCPHCNGHFTVLTGNNELEGTQGSVHCECDACGAQWYEMYTYSYSEEA